MAYDPTNLPGPLELHHYAWITATFFAFLAICVSFFLIWKHLRYYREPVVQRYIVRIILMIPIYTIDSLLSLYFKDAAMYLVLGRDCYEAYVLYMFFRLLIELAGGEEELITDLEEVPQIKYSLPFCCFHIKPGRSFLHRCRQMILQFVIVKPLLSILTFILELCHMYEEGNFSPQYGYLYVTIIYNVSITVSLYFLVLFYEGTKTILAHFKPISKFLCIKAVIFFAFWQSVAISMCVYFELFIREAEGWSIHDVSLAINNWLICIEMFPISFAYAMTFGYKSFKDPSFNEGPRDNAPPNVFKNFFDVMNFVDVLRESRTAMQKSTKREIKELKGFMSLPKSQQQTQVVHQGYLEKKGEDIAKLYKRRFFAVLREPPGIVIFEEDPWSSEFAKKILTPRGWVDFKVVTGVEPRRSRGFNIVTPNRIWRLRCKTSDERPQWMNLVIASCKLKGITPEKTEGDQVELEED
eukprot:TRINITY_DN3647_c0_g1_i1.p1 TRINITY_DN3647_c0_g1~~TRINITY_DN3647_c0_g1_i1.p1  ORF type:complete len:468 (+),score=113.20 TRINITY_DN3647_c0_g1_i1:256-1659(+)